MKHLPNIITMSRIALVILFTALLAADGLPDYALMNSVSGGWFSPISAASCIALWAFILAAVTDFLDGYLARKYQVVSDFGKLMDPLADKILVCAAYVYLTWVGLCPFWATIIIVFREFLVTGIRQIALTRNYVMAADWCGKWKTGFQLAFCIAALVPIAYGGNLPEPLCSLSIGIGGAGLRGILLWASIILTLWSGANYCVQAHRFIGSPAGDGSVHQK